MKGAPPVGVGVGAFQFPVLGAKRFYAGRSFAERETVEMVLSVAVLSITVPGVRS